MNDRFRCGHSRSAVDEHGNPVNKRDTYGTLRCGVCRAAQSRRAGIKFRSSRRAAMLADAL